MADSVLTSRQRWPVPASFADPYYEAFIALIEAIDQSVYGPAREDRNIVLLSTAVVALDVSNNLTWSAAIELLCAPQGLLWTLPAGAVTLADGQILYVQITRAPTSSITVAAVVASQAPLPDTDPESTLVLAVRRGSTVFWRNGATLGVGVSAAIFSGTGAPPSVAIQQAGTAVASRSTLNARGALTATDNTGASRVDLFVPRRGVLAQYLDRLLPMAMGRDTDSSAWVTLGHMGINPAGYVLTGTSLAFRFEVSGYVSLTGPTGQVELTNLDDLAVTAIISITSDAPTSLVTTMVLTAGTYRLRFRCNSSGGPTERFLLDWAGVRAINTLTE